MNLVLFTVNHILVIIYNAHTSVQLSIRANNTRILTFLLYVWHTTPCCTHVKSLTYHTLRFHEYCVFSAKLNVPYSLSHVLTPAQNTDHSIHARSNSGHLDIRKLETKKVDEKSIKQITLYTIAGLHPNQSQAEFQWAGMWRDPRWRHGSPQSITTRRFSKPLLTLACYSSTIRSMFSFNAPHNSYGMIAHSSPR